MANILPNPDPKGLAEELAADGCHCTIPATHDKRSLRLPLTTGRWLQTRRGPPSILSASPKNGS